ncbi:MAG TPA: hypothetical protein VFW16_11460 [Streptosporangiaceae bacterium]|nr:hypothetical protein [Streptosporangiaceae bacterium]
MRYELRDVGDGRCEFLAFDVDPRFDATMEALAWQRSGGAWGRQIACEAAVAEPALANLRTFMSPLLRQAAGLEPVPWQDALDELCSRFEAGGVGWFLGGSAALAVRGAPLTPHDLDLITDDADAIRVGDLLADVILEPVATAEWPLSIWWGRAFLYARVEWAGGMTAAADQPQVTDFGPVAASQLETVRWRGWQLRVPPLHLQRAVCDRRGLTARVAMIDELNARR